MKILITGNKEKGLAAAMSNSLVDHDVEFASRANGWELTRGDQQQTFAEKSLNYDVVILNSALWKFNQTLLLEAVYKKHKAEGRRTLIIAIGSTTDRVKKATDWLYNAEKKALRDYANSLGMTGVWDTNPRVTLISFGTLSNVQEKHPDRKTLPIQDAADYVKWIVEQPSHLHINEISIDPLQA